MTEMFAVFENGKMTGMYSGSRAPFQGRADIVDLPDDFDGWVGIDRKALDATGHVLPVAEQVAAGVIVIDQYHRLDGNEIVKKTDAELVVEGLLPIPPESKLVDGELVPKTQDELIADGLLGIPEGKKLVDGKLVDMTTAEKVVAGLLSVPSGSILDGNDIRIMTQGERCKAGLEPVPFGFELVGSELVAQSEEQRERSSYDKDAARWTESVCERILYHLSKKLSDGFTYQGLIVQADPAAQQNANGFLTALSAGMPVLPIVWRTKDNTNIVIESESDFKLFATAMLVFVQSCYHTEWAAKDAVRAAADFDTAWVAYQGYMA